VKALLILWLKSLGVLIVAVLVLATTQHWDESATGRSIGRPIGTITTRDRWAVIDGDRMRMLTKEEGRDAMSFPTNYILPQQHRLAMHMLGNAVPPVVAYDVLNAIKAAA